MKICRNAYKSFIHPLPRWDTVLYTHISPFSQWVVQLVPISVAFYRLHGHLSSVNQQIYLATKLQLSPGLRERWWCNHATVIALTYIYSNSTYICCCCSRGAGGRRDGNVGVYTGGMVYISWSSDHTTLSWVPYHAPVRDFAADLMASVTSHDLRAAE